MLVGSQDYTEPLRASKLVRSVRTGDSGEGIVADPSRVDPMQVPSRSFTEQSTTADLFGYADSVVKSGGLGIYTFHGVGGDYIAISPEAHQALLRYLAGHRKEIWVAPFSEVMDWVTASGAERWVLIDLARRGVALRRLAARKTNGAWRSLAGASGEGGGQAGRSKAAAIAEASASSCRIRLNGSARAIAQSPASPAGWSPVIRTCGPGRRRDHGLISGATG